MPFPWIVALAALAGAPPPDAAPGTPGTPGAPALARAALTRPPVLVRYVEAPYPEAARRAGRDAVVVLRIDVDREGLVQRVEVVEASDPEFAGPAMEAACGFEFTPAEAGALGRVPVRIIYRYGFTLRPVAAAAPARTSTGAATSSSGFALRRAEPRGDSTSSAPGAATSSSGFALRRAERPEVRTSTAIGPTPGPIRPAPQVLPPATRAPINFSGRVKESASRRPLAFARVEVTPVGSGAGSGVGSATVARTRTATETDADGRFAFRGLSPGAYAVSIRAALHDRVDATESLRPGEALEVLYYLRASARSPYEVVVRAQVERDEVARRTIEMQDVERLPGTQGDALRVIQDLPGLARTPFGVGLLVVRGAQPQDTGVFLDGHQVPLLFHFGGIGGLTSVINARMLEAIDFFPGGFGPEQGRISGGAVELRSKFAETDRVHGEANLDIAGASIFLEGPATSDPGDGAFVLALRRSYVDGILAGVTSALDSSLAIAPRYYDYQARYDRPLGSSARMLSVLAYGSDDELVLLGTQAGPIPSGTQSRTYFHRLNPRFTYRGSQGESLVISPIIGLDSSNLATTGDPSGNASHLRIDDWIAGLRVDGAVRLDPALRLRAGGDVQHYRFSSDSEVPAFPRAKAFPSPIATDVPPRKDQSIVPSTVASLYAEAELRLTDDLIFLPGLRLDTYTFAAEPQPLIDPRLVDGRTIVGLDPRLAARYRLEPRLWLKGQAGVYREPPLPPELYLNADLPLQTANQYSVGTEWDILDRLSLDLQLYFRRANQVPGPTADVVVANGVVRPLGFTAQSANRSYGMELMLKLEKRWGLFGWIAYTLSRSEVRRSDGSWRANQLLDQTHNLVAVATYDLGLDWFASLRFRYVTGGGLAVTGARWYDSDQDGYRRTTTNDLHRVPAFQQLDLRIDRRWRFDEWYLEAYLDVQNVYNARNTELFAPSFDFKSETAIPGVPLFPIIGLRGVF